MANYERPSELHLPSINTVSRILTILQTAIDSDLPRDGKYDAARRMLTEFSAHLRGNTADVVRDELVSTAPATTTCLLAEIDSHERGFRLQEDFAFLQSEMEWLNRIRARTLELAELKAFLPASCAATVDEAMNRIGRHARSMKAQYEGVAGRAVKNIPTLAAAVDAIEQCPRITQLRPRIAEAHMRVTATLGYIAMFEPEDHEALREALLAMRSRLDTVDQEIKQAELAVSSLVMTAGTVDAVDSCAGGARAPGDDVPTTIRPKRTHLDM
jgi:hypothetical protein